MENYVSQEYSIELWKFGIHLDSEKRHISGSSEVMSFDELNHDNWEEGVTEIDIRGIWGRSIEVPSLSELLEAIPLSVTYEGNESFFWLKKYKSGWSALYVLSVLTNGTIDMESALNPTASENKKGIRTVLMFDNPCDAIADALIRLTKLGLYNPKKAHKGFSPN